MRISFTGRFISFILLFSAILYAQSSQFSIDAYKSFLQQHQNMTTQELLQMHDAGTFSESIPALQLDPLYLDSIKIKYELTDYENDLLNKHGFFVTERLSGENFGEQFSDVFHKDLPVFISTDAILHAFHVSYDNILKTIELQVVIPKLGEFLSALHSQMQQLEDNYSSEDTMATMLKDVDLYLTVARTLLNETGANPFYDSNSMEVNSLIQKINSYNAAGVPLFSRVSRSIDFSQFKPRAHYEDDPVLQRYFKAMMWLGRIEIYLIAPDSDDFPPGENDMKRQIIDALLFPELIELAGVRNIYDELEEIIAFFVGEQDNVTLPRLEELRAELNISSASDILKDGKFEEFQNTLKSKSYAFQRILSQILFSDPLEPNTIVPASAFLMFGQRFIPDSYVTGNVVYDKILYNGVKIRRMLPSTLDVLFANGNDAALQLLTDELDEYHYSTNLASVRYLLDSYEDEFWNSSIYLMWLNTLSTLNPPEDRSGLPSFMKTAAWWQFKMNTQLASWAELRHDNLLYAKQSYSAGVSCSFPHAYVEPAPEFFERLSEVCLQIKSSFEASDFTSEPYKNYLSNYFDNFASISDTLKMVAEKELSNTEFSEAEKKFLSGILYEEPVCGVLYTGWYKDLYLVNEDGDGLLKKDFLVADYHTSSTDEVGEMVGWVKHAGTGKVDMAVLTADLPGEGTVAFVGPVMSYHEYTTEGFLRLTDNEWKETYLSASTRPNWVNLYLADADGQQLEAGGSLITSVSEPSDIIIPDYEIVAQNFPNPFNPSTLINFKLPHGMSNVQTVLNIYDIKGELVKTLLDKELSSGNYIVRWNGDNLFDQPVSSGVYLYEIKAGTKRFTGKMNLLK